MKQRSLADVPEQAFLIPSRHDVVLLEEEGKDGKPGSMRFKMLAHSGKPIPDHGFFGTFAVNLSGISWPKGDRLPALLDHDSGKRIGYTDKLQITERGLEAEGVMLSNQAANEVRLDSKAGFPWQASVRLRATKVLDIGDGEEHEVNGHKLTGPATVFEECALREVTFTAFGADPHTSAAALASRIAGPAAAPQKDDTMTDKQNAPPAPPVDETKLRAEGEGAERLRVTTILAAAGDEQKALAAELVQKGATVQDALLALNADLRARLASKQKAAEPEAKPLGNVPPQEKQQKLADQPEGPAKWTAQWEADEALRDEFMGSKAAWLSYNANRHRCKDYGSAAAFAASGTN